MIKFEKILLFILTSTLLFSCYDAMEINTENASKVEIPVKLEGPGMGGTLVLEFDSFFNSDEVEDGLISYDDVSGVASFKYNVEIDFYDELADFLSKDDDELDFSNISAFKEAFGLDVDMSNPTVDLREPFKDKYESNSIFYFPNVDEKYPLTFVEKGQPVDLGVNDDAYKVRFTDGFISMNITSSNLPEIADEYMTMFSLGGIPLPEPMKIPIFQGLPQLPEAIKIIIEVQIESLLDVNAPHTSFSKRDTISSFDESIQIDLADYYYSKAAGDGKVELELTSAYMHVVSLNDTAIVPLPDTLYFGTTITDVVFEHVVFNHKIETVLDSSQSFDIDVFSDFPDNLNVEGFKLLEPEMTLEVVSNLGFPALFEINTLQFETEGEPEPIADAKVSVINLRLPSDPMDINEFVVPHEGSLHLDPTNSRLEDLDLLNIRGLSVGYKVVVNPDDNADQEGMHNFFYNYADDVIADMYDVKLNAEVKIPFNFKFDKICFQETMESPLTSNDLDSVVYMSDNDSISLHVKMETKDFPFNAVIQFYFDELDDDGNLVHVDSLFALNKTLLPSSTAEEWDSTTWSVVLDNEKYEHVKGTDSLTFEVSMTMTEDEFFLLNEGRTTEIRYNFKLGASSFVVRRDGTDE